YFCFVDLAQLDLFFKQDLAQVSSYAHVGDYSNGTYTGTTTPKNLKFRIETSAQTELLSSDVYNAVSAWNGISSNVGSIGIAMAVPGMPTTGFCLVIGREYSDGILGQTVSRDSNGNIVSADSDWNSVSIYMNTSSTIFSGADNPTTAAKKTFIHEVGHALKLSHPINDARLSGHIYSGLPKAVMNQGLPNDYVSSTVASHDKENLKAKWGK
ncbi:MAG: hypothetical protein NC084_00815, partial [Bacteroides sp.]|nr:hypothetical protein [Eubacterium sp.]MCM1417792.1 hypothetical protein [Roseburia sp.]MCM1461231.1 hypothetical protein [Bacteroides sp.]